MKCDIVSKMVKNGYMKHHEINNPLVVILRMLAVPVVLLCVSLRIHPTVLTFMSLGLGSIGALSYFRDARISYVIAWTASVILDYADGMVARKSGKETYFGYLLDMLGDRVKLILIVVAWSLSYGNSSGYILAGTVVSLLVFTEVVSHLFVSHSALRDSEERSLWSMGQRMALEFDMHSFLIYGFGILLGGQLGFAATVWLLLLLVLSLRGVCKARIFRNRVLCIRFNIDLLRRFL